MRATEKFVFVLMLLTALLAGSCAKDNCPVCTEKNEVLALLHAEYSEVDFGSAVMTAGALFFGDPIPQVDSVLANGVLLAPIEEDAAFPVYGTDLDSHTTIVFMQAVVNGAQLQQTIIVPDSFWIIEPAQMSLVPSDTPLTILWAESERATSYRLRIMISSPSSGLLLDTLLYIDSLSYVIPSRYVIHGYGIDFQLAAVCGPTGEPGEPGNIRSSKFEGFATGLYSLPMWSVFAVSQGVASGKSPHAIQSDAIVGAERIGRIVANRGRR